MEHLLRSPGVKALRRVQPDISVLPRDTQLVRIWFSDTPHPAGFAHFRTFGPTTSRFDHHIPRADGGPREGDRGIFYAIVAEADPDASTAAIAEVFQATRVIDLRTGGPRLAFFKTTADIPVLDLAGYWPTRVGASATISSGMRETAREWSRDFHDAYPQISGLRYRSSMSGGQSLAVALYERSAAAMPGEPELDRPLDDPHIRHLVSRAAELLGYGIV